MCVSACVSHLATDAPFGILGQARQQCGVSLDDAGASAGAEDQSEK